MATPPPPSTRGKLFATPLVRYRRRHRTWEDMLAAARREMEETLQAEIQRTTDMIADLQKENKELKLKLEKTTADMDLLRASFTGAREEGEIPPVESIKEDLKKELQQEMEASQGKWVEVVRKTIKKEVQEETVREDHSRVQETLDEERLRQARRLNIRISGLVEGASPEADAAKICTQLGYGDQMPFSRVWRAGKDASRTRALVLQMKSSEERVAFFRKRALVRTLPGSPLYIDEDLTKMQIEHRRTCMPQILQARKEGRKAFYRDGRIFIDGRPAK